MEVFDGFFEGLPALEDMMYGSTELEEVRDLACLIGCPDRVGVRAGLYFLFYQCQRGMWNRFSQSELSAFLILAWRSVEQASFLDHFEGGELSVETVFAIRIYTIYYYLSCVRSPDLCRRICIFPQPPIEVQSFWETATFTTSKLRRAGLAGLIEASGIFLQDVLMYRRVLLTSTAPERLADTLAAWTGKQAVELECWLAMVTTILARRDWYGLSHTLEFKRLESILSEIEHVRQELSGEIWTYITADMLPPMNPN